MTVGDAMKAANQHGSSYSVLTGNCIHAAKDVMKKIVINNSTELLITIFSSHLWQHEYNFL